MSFARSAEYTFLSSPNVAGIGLGIRVKLDGNTGFIVPAGASDMEIGVVENSNENAAVVAFNPDGSIAASNQSKRPLRVRLWNAYGTVDVASSGTISAGDRVRRADNGRVAKWDSVADSAIAPYGFALGNGIAPTDIIEVLPIPGSSTTSGGGSGGSSVVLSAGDAIVGGTW
ncbi:MAG: hypothetical protein WCO60_18300 [Verrucomicrobiota bacterium]